MTNGCSPHANWSVHQKLNCVSSVQLRRSVRALTQHEKDRNVSNNIYILNQTCEHRKSGKIDTLPLLVRLCARVCFTSYIFR